MRAWRAAVVGVAAMAAVTAGCSSSETTSASSGSSTSAPTTSAGAPGSTPGTTAKRSSTTTAPTTTAAPGSPKAAFLEAGNAICKKMNADSLALTKAYDASARTPALTQQMLDANAALIEQAITDLEALPQPPGDEAQLATVYADARQLAALGHQMAAASGQSDKAAIEAVAAQANGVQKAANASATAYGLTECGKGS